MTAQRTPTIAGRTVIAVPQRRRAAGTALGCAVVVLALAGLVHGQKSGTAFDDRVYAAIVRRLSTGTLTALLHLTDPIPVTIALAALAGAAAARRHWRLFTVTVGAPPVALLLTEVVLKPVVHRTHEGQLAYPSGHQSAPACLTAILALLILRAGWTRLRKIAALAVLVLYLALCSIALVGAFLHYVTDTIGAVCLSISCVLAAALLADRAFRRS
jgi:undecaprenyl-diphosphatase